MEILINSTLVDLLEHPTDIYGLNFKPQFKTHDNDADWESFTKGCAQEVSQEAYAFVWSFTHHYATHGILEIGVSRNGDGSFTHALLRDKPNHIPYLGIDLEDKSFLNSKEKNIYTLQENSFNQDRVRSYAKEIGLEKISILLIDGHHSLNAVINDWRYADMLSEAGAVIFHDVNFHPGPAAFLHAIDRSKFSVIRYLEKDSDYGLGVAYKL